MLCTIRINMQNIQNNEYKRKQRYTNVESYE